MNKKNKFDKMANSWWDLDGSSKFLHKMNPVRIKYISLRSQGIFGKKILDIGCGAGILSEGLSKEGGMVTGIDTSKKMIHHAKYHAKKNKIKVSYIHEDAKTHLKKYKKFYDIITCMEVLEHVEYPKDIINSCSHLIKDKGDIFFSTINRTAKSFFYSIILAEYILKIIPKKTHDFSKFITPSELLDLIDNTSLKEKDIIGLCYNPILKKFYLSKCVDTNYIIHIKN
ncbi:ubiG [Wigglesworthia glossinidia endosymbiont of Glossina brevipalpis]|uniref:Ubiquinone biosynthesis O-methyltransferase n=1 Tax=Wigglesworthia glossinidia brevipalpis TaxID=36870 RepID=Q8D2B0_WIGBR|nr:ubiG [Wigglesworthia glossinidia endosymbiont of Glossina brevipalpis]